jgi:hypothetical protein
VDSQEPAIHDRQLSPQWSPSKHVAKAGMPSLPGLNFISLANSLAQKAVMSATAKRSPGIHGWCRIDDLLPHNWTPLIT